ncbi:MAG: hypothetical protein LBC79_07700 [Deltaproteobacteria bacterium]|jgi:hypothetical protein|nr:hypothetical protein [Deltaproteobacteria bacterium]
MKRVFPAIAMIVLLVSGTAFGRVRHEGITGTYVNRENNAVLTVKATGKNRYTIRLQSNNPECGFDTRAELKNWDGIGFNLGLIEANYHAFIKGDKTIYIEALLAKKHCREYVEGDYTK